MDVNKKTISVDQAYKITEKKKMTVSKTTIRTWITKYGLGKKIGGRYYVYLDKFIYFLENGQKK